jgi:hypothetical protein
MTSGYLETIESFGKVTHYFPDNSEILANPFKEDMNLRAN